jgi:sucrose-6-phosphate hydrolase SacC (GH32 family)
MKKYLVLPVNDDKPVKHCFIRSGDKLLQDFTIALDFETPRVDVYVDVTRFGGAELTLTDEAGEAVPYRTADRHPTVAEIPGGDVLRPAAHYTTTIGWINDPNGLIYVNGRYHMFYQHNPMGVNWGNMTWGHAISEDLVHWTEVGDALFPDETGTMFSGSAICDERNVAGFGAGAILLYYTAAGRNSELSKDAPFTQCLAYSTDNGETFTKYEKNPIIQHIIGGNRDPKVQWSDELGKYTLSLYLDGKDYCIFASDNLLD